MLLNMDGFDDNTTSAFYGANSWGTAFTTSSFLPTASGSVSESLNPTRSDLHSTDQTSSTSDPTRSLISTTTRPLARSREDVPWQMYLSPSLSDSLHSLDLDILNPNPLDLVYPQHDPLANFAEFETLESPRLSGYQGTQTVNDVQQMFCTAPLVAPQPRIIQPALLSLVSTQDTEDSHLLAQGESSTKTDEHTTVYTSSISDVGVLSAPQFGTTYLANSAPSSSLLSSSGGRDPTITKLVDTSTRPRRRGLTGWGNTSHLEPPVVPSSTLHQKPPSTTSSSKSLNSGLLLVPDSLSPSLCSSTGGSSRNSERLLKRLRQSDESLPILKHASKTRRIMAADVDTEDDRDSVDNNNDGDDSDSDDYKPSRSPSPSLNPSRSISPSFMFKSETGVASTSSFNNKKKPKKGKGKAKGSAALALAVVSQMVRNPSAAGRRDTDFTSTRYTNTGITRRKNQPIPLPIPVPNLNKKSRGRKVPHVINNDTTVMMRRTRRPSSSTKVLVKKEEDDDDDDESGEDDDQSRSSNTSRSRRKKSTPEMSKTPSGENRTFICVVPGCGKCFVRSEHLKRHVRSIHTHDKREFFWSSPFFFFSFIKSFFGVVFLINCSSSLPF